MIKSTLVIIYFYFFLPLLIGIAIHLWQNNLHCLSFVYVSGYMVYFALFDLYITRAQLLHLNYTRTAENWKKTVCIITFIIFCSILISLPKAIAKHPKGLKDSFTHPFDRRKNTILLGLTIALIIIAVCFLTPNAFDETPELARLSLAHDTFFSVDPLSGNIYTKESAYPGCIHLFYTIGSTLSGVDATTLIHLFMPLFMLPLFICSYVCISMFLFPKDSQDKHRFSFVCLILLFYSLLLPLESHISVTPFRNIWNGITLSASTLLPLSITICLNSIKHYHTKKSQTNPNVNLSLSESIIYFICSALSIHLCIRLGLIVCALYLFIAILFCTITRIHRQKLLSTKRQDVRGGVRS